MKNTPEVFKGRQVMFIHSGKEQVLIAVVSNVKSSVDDITQISFRKSKGTKLRFCLSSSPVSSEF